MPISKHIPYTINMTNSLIHCVRHPMDGVGCKKPEEIIEQMQSVTLSIQMSTELHGRKKEEHVGEQILRTSEYLDFGRTIVWVIPNSFFSYSPL